MTDKSSSPSATHDEADKAALLGAPLEKGPGGFMFPTVETLAKLLCVANRIPVVDPGDTSQNWWMFSEFATKMLKGLSAPSETPRSEAPFDAAPKERGLSVNSIRPLQGEPIESARSAIGQKPEWLIWSNEHRAWWGPDRSGYRSDVFKAGRYTIEDARSICRVRSWEGGMPPEAMIHEKDAEHGQRTV